MDIRKVLAKILPIPVFKQIMYYKHFGKFADFKNPKTFNEKTMWISIYYHNPLYTKCADKIRVREYLVEKLGEQEAKKLICEQYGTWDNPEDIDFQRLPDSFVLKSNHASGQVILCKDKAQLDIEKVKKKMSEWLSYSYYNDRGEWQYKHIKPQILAERLLESDIVDYRIFCFEGEPTYIKTTKHNPETKGGYDCALYYPDWTPTDFKMAQAYGSMNVPKPEKLDYMLEVARKLSKDFHFVRVDLYSVENNIYFAELTFTPNSGCEKFESQEVDERFGKLFSIPNDEFVRREKV